MFLEELKSRERAERLGDSDYGLVLCLQTTTEFA